MVGMNRPTSHSVPDLASKIARLVEERGWNQEDFARISSLNRQTVRQILLSSGNRRMRNATVGACARALGLSVNELRQQPLDRLLPFMNRPPHAQDRARENQQYEKATQPELVAWLERNPGRAEQLSAEETDELLSLQGTGGPLTAFGVEHFIDLIERKRRLIQQVHAVAGTEYFDVLEKMVGLMFDKIQPYADRK
jgi:transcriptional regulator with XRE-family HTH domain